MTESMVCQNTHFMITVFNKATQSACLSNYTAVQNIPAKYIYIYINIYMNMSNRPQEDSVS